jgi:hypothetical protein
MNHTITLLFTEEGGKLDFLRNYQIINTRDIKPTLYLDAIRNIVGYLTSNDLAPDLFEEFDKMRLEVEPILQRAKLQNNELPDCKSQSLRAKKTVEWINLLPLNERKHWFKDKGALTDFLSLHSAVNILESREIERGISARATKTENR